MTFECPKWPPDWPEIGQSVESVLRSGAWGQYHSDICKQLEKRLSRQFETAVARLCCSGTAALEIALRAQQIGPGDEVILAAYDYPGNFRTVELVGARPVLVDVHPDTVSLDPNLLKAAASPSVRAVIATHLYGQPAQIDAIRLICDQQKWLLIEDACQVMGMTIAGQPAGSFGDLATLSFGGSKLVSAGCGGALLAKSERLAARLGPLLDRPGETYPLAPLQAAAINPQLDRLAELNHRRAANVEWLSDHQAAMPHWRMIENPKARRFPDRDKPDLEDGNHSAPDANDSAPAHYKTAWIANSQTHRTSIIQAAKDRNLPIGAGFRSASRCSSRRCRKPVETPYSQTFGEQLFVLDHRALLVNDDQRKSLLQVLTQLHDDTAKTN
ncbi:MAG: DegT/DnrJ/EryC1/StrS aminotransferase family protein [Rubripirellula sp.]|nr:DegT/DnrJ/EryC1/StrS aminotransferase family protein [Rubripirellula sp.]